MTARDLDTLLAAMDPVADLDLPAPDSQVGRDIRRAALAEGRPRSHRRILVAVAALVLIATAAAVAIVLRSETPSSFRILCYGDLDTEVPQVEGLSGETAAARACGAFWQDGPFGDDGTVPPLASCVLASGAIGVFPGTDEVCAELDLPVAVDIEVLDPLVELNGRLSERIVDQGCVDFGSFEAAARQLIVDLELDAAGWSVEVPTAPSAERPCASYSLDTERLRLVLVPIPDVG